MIPKIIHLCWLSGDPFPKDIQKYIDTWHKVLPDYRVQLWNFDRFPKDKSVWVSEAFDRRKYAFAADYIRNYALYHEGGIYLDADIEVLKTFDDLLQLPYFLGYENGSGMIDAGVMASEKGNGIFKAMLDYYEDRHFVKPDGSLDTLPLPKVMHKVLSAKGYEFVSIDGPEQFDHTDGRISILPFDYFSPIHLENRRLEMTDRTRAIHRFSASWVPWYLKTKRMIKKAVGPSATAWFIKTKRRLLGKPL